VTGWRIGFVFENLRLLLALAEMSECRKQKFHLVNVTAFCIEP
jgi:hypothetical protein